ncbi:hypothetical protein MBLNU457_5765t1 [Dothideomycetes sp. NU457]
MNPLQKNKVDINSLSPEEQRLFRMYGKLPNKKDLLDKKLKGQERKYFDSGDYALSKAGKADDGGVTAIGREHPSPNTIPHLSSSNPAGTPSLQPTQSQGHAGSPVKESSILQRGISVDEQEAEVPKDDLDRRAEAVSPPPQVEGVPIGK